MRTLTIKNALTWTAYPVVMLVCIGLFMTLKGMGFALLACTYIPIMLGAGSITFLELYNPHIKSWIANKSDVGNDLLFMVTVQMILPNLLAFLIAVSIIKILAYYSLGLTGFWPHAWPIGVQAVLMILTADFFRYWLHKFSHENNTLWKLHAVHHSPKKLYWLNVGRFHPIEKSLQFFVDALPFIVLGVREEVLALYFVFYAVNGFFQHCNIELRFGFLNYIISSAELHRWHHSRLIEESNANYGNNIIIWDILFGTYFFPRDRLVGELGLFNNDYPLDFKSQLRTPFAGNIDKQALPLLKYRDIAMNWLLKLRMIHIRLRYYAPYVRSARNPWKVQENLLHKILQQNRNTRFGKEHSFAKIKNYAQFKEFVPLHDYEQLRPYFEEQEKTGESVIHADMPIMYNETSGTTGKPKYIPVMEETISNLRKSQRIFSYVQYRIKPEAFYGKLLGLVSPANEGTRASGIPFGSASGLIYKTMPKIIRGKYVLPAEVFEIKDYDTKYYTIMRLALAQKDITYLASANPSTFHRLLEVMNSQQDLLLHDIKSGTIAFLDKMKPAIASTLKQSVKPNPKRATELAEIFGSIESVGFSQVWPYLKIVTTWTGGSCGIALSSLLPKLPRDAKVVELGYMSSEFRGTITIDLATNAGLPTLRENFFEFVEKEKWEQNDKLFLTIEELEQGQEYYLVVTTKSGLYRYNMNDIVTVTGKFQNTPTLKFVQKGKGVTNITGEKLYESQVILAMQKAEQTFGCHFRFYQMLANQAFSGYELYFELGDKTAIADNKISAYLDEQLGLLNLEYQVKRESNRLKPVNAFSLRQGTFERFKTACLQEGQREGQFKTIVLQYKKDILFDFQAHVLEPKT